MRSALLDTDIFSEVLKRRDPFVAETANRYLLHHQQLSLTTVTILEMVSGLHRMERIDRIDQLANQLSGHEILTLNDDNAFLAGRIYAALEQAVQRIGVVDTVNAAIAIGCGLQLVTGNTKHYQRVIDLGYPLELNNWRQADASC